MLRVRLTEQEAERYKLKADKEGITLSELVRKSLESHQTIVISGYDDEMKKLFLELSRIGNYQKKLDKNLIEVLLLYFYQLLLDRKIQSCLYDTLFIFIFYRKSADSVMSSALLLPVGQSCRHPRRSQAYPLPRQLPAPSLAGQLRRVHQLCRRLQP